MRSNETGQPDPAEHAVDWHAADGESMLAQLGTSRHGLSATDAARRLERFGPNRLPPPARRGSLARLLSQFHNLLIYVLLGSAVVSVLLGHMSDALVILAVVLANAVIGFVQEGRAEQALEAMRHMVGARARVLRDGRHKHIEAYEIVPGDAVVIEAGDRVPADLRLLQATQLRIDEAALTGESVPVDKAAAPVAADAALGDRASMAHSGTLVTAGRGLGIAVATAGATELGRISALLGRVQTLKTPLLRQVDAFASRLTFVILIVCALAFAYGFLVRGYAVDEAFMVVVGLAVSAIPEGLPAVMTITLAIGVRRMAARHAIIRRLPAVETLGSVSVICSDKTGTLTRNEMSVQSIATSGGDYDVTGAGYAPHGKILADGVRVEAACDPALAALVRAAVLDNDASLHDGDDGWKITGDPMEAALLTLAGKAGFDAADTRERHPRTHEIAFDAERRYMATRHEDASGDAFIVVKGAPERVLEMCSGELGPNGPRAYDEVAWHSRADKLGARGQRMLALATKPSRARMLTHDDVDGDLTLLGLVGLIDPPREEAVAAVTDCRAAGIRVLMITGDHAETAREIARQLGLAEAPRVLTGRELDTLDDAALAEAVVETHVFARTSPAHKLRLVDALQGLGLTVAMTGDGVNDAPALKRADVGVAMGVGGTEVAKEAAEMVLADDNFASIVAAVREGRTVYDNLMKVISWTLPTNGGEAATILGAMALGLALPITPIQILWINLVTAAALGITLAFEPTEPGVMQRAPRRPGASILGRDLVWRVVFVSALFVAGAFGIFAWAEARGVSLEHGRTLVVNTLVVLEIFYLFSVRYVHGTSLTLTGVLGTRAVLTGVAIVTAAQLLFTYAPFMQRIFDTRPVTLVEGLVIVTTGLGLLAIVEIEKRLRRALQATGTPAS